jgi:cytochrome c
MKRIKEFAQEQIKVFGPAIGLALVVVIFAVIAADVLYQPKTFLKRGFKIELAADGQPVAKKEEKPVILSELMKLADVNRGAKIFKKCASCHTAGRGEAAKVGPNLFGIVGKKRAAFAGFSYSEAMKAKGGAWDRESISQFITKPKDFIPGTKMAFPGLKKPQDRADVILFLESQR